jgi:ABC-type transport system involved in multi-copper enzyme maturation permease subunit
MWPVIFRELRAESRRPFTYWLRIIGAVAILAAVLFTLQQPSRWSVRTPFGAAPVFQSHQIMGRLLFGNVNAALFALTWIIVPLLTADCINRERREGTLGLLFLTPLTAEGIVVGKSFAHALRALTFVLTMLPVLAVPLLVGGVGPKDLLLALLVDFSALLLALAAGLIASSWTKQWMSAVLLAETLSFVFAVVMMSVHLACFRMIISSAVKMGGAGPGGFGAATLSGWTSYSSGRHAYPGGFIQFVLGLFHFNTASDVEMSPIWIGGGVSTRFMFGGVWDNVWTSGNATIVRAWFWTAGMIFITAAALFGIAILLAAWRIRRSWRLQAPTARAVELERTFCQPRYWSVMFRKKMRRSLERNPIGWLQQYSVASRLTKWGWCLFVVIVECLLALNLNDVDTGQLFVFGVLLLAMAFSAAGSFRRERETGALELLLVTPLRVRQIVGGRVHGIWMQFLPATMLALAAAFYVSTFRGWWNDSQMAELGAGFCVLLSSFVAVPVIGLYWSMRRANFLAAWIGVAVTALLLPWCLAWSWSVLRTHQEPVSALFVFMWLQIGLATVCGVRLMSNLSARRFVVTT